MKELLNQVKKAESRIAQVMHSINESDKELANNINENGLNDAVWDMITVSRQLRDLVKNTLF